MYKRQFVNRGIEEFYLPQSAEIIYVSYFLFLNTKKIFNAQNIKTHYYYYYYIIVNMLFCDKSKMSSLYPVILGKILFLRPSSSTFCLSRSTPLFPTLFYCSLHALRGTTSLSVFTYCRQRLPVFIRCRGLHS